MARKLIEVLLHDGGSSYHVTIAEAKQLTRTEQAKWLNPRQIKRSRDVSKRGLWAVVGRAAMYSEGVALGPKFGTLQLT